MAIDVFRQLGALPEAKQRAREITIIVQDPTFRDERGRIVRARVSVPADWLDAGPRGQRFHVVDYDATSGELRPKLDLRDPDETGEAFPWSCKDRFRKASDRTLETDFLFHAQNVYAIAARTLAAFEFALGRRLAWAFPGHQLFLVPHAFAEANAHYAGDDRGVFCGYLEGAEGRTVYTCLSHDIVAHEVTHAILDGLRPRFIEPSLPDQPAFHEAFADIVALLSVFSVGELVEAVLGKPDREGRIPAESATSEELAETALFSLAEQFGEEVSGVRGSSLRRSLKLPAGTAWQNDGAFEEEHRRGEVIVAAVLRTLLSMWTRRLKALTNGRALDRERAAEEGAKAAAHLLRMAIRGIDYAPSVELEFADFLDAVLVADQVVAPDDEHRYRPAVEKAFRAFGIVQPEQRIVDIAALPFTYTHLNFAALRSDRDEVFRFIWQNADALEIDRRYYLRVDSVRPSTRVGPDGLVINEIVADYAQTLTATAAAAAKAFPELELPAGLDPETELQFWGGGTLIFDQFGMAKFHQHKRLDDWERQNRRLAYLARKGYVDRFGRLGFSLGTPRGLRFAAFHEPDDRAGEDW
jgi:hypothetical protein